MSSAKFSSSHNKAVKDMLKPYELLAPEFHALCDSFSNLMLYSASKPTWAKHCSAWKLYNEFCKQFGVSFTFPITHQYVRAFATWATMDKKLKSTTVKSYISSLNVAHTMGNIDYPNLSSDACTKMVVKGAKNFCDPGLKSATIRIPMDINLLTILGHKISKLEWSDFAKQVFWSACTTSFFSSCRMGEILSPNEKTFDPSTGLLWGNVKFFREKEVIMFIPYTKTTAFEGKFIELYPIKGSILCPASALIRLKEMAESEGVWDCKKPVFMFKSGKLLTKNKLNLWLNNLLGEFMDSNHVISGHSFRAAIPSLLASNPDRDTAKWIQEWGGWSSDSFHLYTKNKREERKSLFKKIVSSIM